MLRPLPRLLTFIIPCFALLFGLSLIVFHTLPSSMAANLNLNQNIRHRSSPSLFTQTCAGWQSVTSPNQGTIDSTLNGVTAIGSDDVWAVGDFSTTLTLQTLTEHWNGITWSIIPSPNMRGTTNNSLTSVTAISTKDVWAVGYTSAQPLVEHWGGKTWQIVSSPSVAQAQLHDIVRVPGTGQLWAVGYTGTDQTFVEHWDGNTWTVVPSPTIGSYNFLNSIAAISSNDIWAVGGYNETPSSPAATLIEHWDGSTWSIVTSPNPGISGSVFQKVIAVPGSNQLWAIGSYVTSTGMYETLTEHWDGTVWTIISSPNQGPENPHSVNALIGAVAFSTSNIWAVGSYQNTNGVTPTQPLIEHWDGTTWSIITSPNPDGYSFLDSITKVSGTKSLWAVGTSFYSNGNGGTYQTLTERYC